ncbi:MAG: hypothetical protein KDK70_43105 [Myxococcales bacterium]|nr:hypothetical protein [Myxococcales bacterium]
MPAPPSGMRLRRGARELEPVPGVVLEGQFALDDDRGHLLLLTDDSPYEEVLHVVLLDHAQRIVEQLDLGEPYVPGLLRDVQVVGADTLRFRFFEGKIHQLEVHRQPRGLLRRRRLQLTTRPWDSAPTAPRSA